MASLVDAPVGEDVDIEPLTRDEARQILRVAAEPRNGARWSVALAVGIRQSEALGLRWQFVDLDAGTVEVGWQLRRARFGMDARIRPPALAAGTGRRARAAAPGAGTGTTVQPTALLAAIRAQR